jgi:hypothetical protein
MLSICTRKSSFSLAIRLCFSSKLLMSSLTVSTNPEMTLTYSCLLYRETYADSILRAFFLLASLSGRERSERLLFSPGPFSNCSCATARARLCANLIFSLATHSGSWCPDSSLDRRPTVRLSPDGCCDMVDVFFACQLDTKSTRLSRRKDML